MASMDPDLLLKMSKKIAQLTKVIFLLNTKNEDAASELQTTIASHRKETEALAKDAATKMTQLKETLEKKDAMLKGMENLKKIKERHKAEKQEAFAQFERYKDDVKRATREADDQYKKDLQAMTEELKRVRSAFQERIGTLKTSLELVQSKVHSGSAEMDSLKKKHTEEIADMVTESNRKYNDMLTSQLNQQDQLRAQFEKQLESLQRAHESALTQAQEKADAEARIAIKRRELECNTSADAVKNEMVSKMERLLSELEALRANEAQLRTDKQELQTQLGGLRAEHKQIQIEVAALNKSKSEQISSNEAVVASLKLNLQEREHQVQILQDELAKLRALLNKLESDRNTMQSALESLTKDRDSGHLELTEKEKEWSLKYQTKDAEVGKLNALIKGQESEVRKLRELIKTNEAHNIKSEDELKRQLLALQKKLTEAQGSASSKEVELQTRIQALKNELAELHKTSSERYDKALQDAQDQLTKTKLELNTAMSTALADLGNQHAKQLEKLKESSKEASGKERQALEAQISSLQLELSKSQSILQASNDQIAALNKDILRYKGEVKLFADQLKEAESSSAKSIKDLKQKSSQLETQKDADAKQIQKLKSKVSTLESELKTLKTMLDNKTKSSDDAIVLLKQNFQAQIDTLNATKESAIAAAIQEAENTMQKHIEEQRAFLLSMHATDIQAIEAQIEVWKKKLYEREAENANDRAEFQKLIMAQDEQYKEQFLTLKNTHEANLESLRVNHSLTITTQQQDAAAQLEATIRKMQNAYDSLLASSNDKLQNALDSATKEQVLWQKRLNDTIAEAEKLRKEEAEFHEREIVRQIQSTKREKDVEREIAIKNLNENHHQVVATKEEAIEKMNKLAAEQADTIRKLYDDIKQQQAILEHKQEDWKATLKTLAEEKLQALEAQTKQHNSELDHLVDEHLRETQQLNAQFEKTRSMLQEQQQILISKIREWENVYARRDSRVEDLNRISELEQEVAEKDALVRQTVEEMAYIKRELLNREDVYNKTFGRNPNVGVLQVLKPTVLNPNPVGPPKPNRKTKPQTSLNLNNNPRPLPPIGTTNQQGTYRDLNHQL